MAQLNPNFEIDFSDINSYEQIQLINDTQLAKENLLMHRAYQEPADDEIIRNHFSSFTFVDFCPKLFTIKQQQRLLQQKQQHCPGPHGQQLKYYELETFSDLFERINKWLKLNKDWRVVSMETLVFDCKTHFNYLKSSTHSTYLPQNTRGLRLFLSPSKSRFAGPQKIGCINVVPRKLSGSHINPGQQPVVYETLSDILDRLNELLLSRPIEGRILSVETITLPMSNGFVNTESNYFMDSRLNLLHQSTYSMAGVDHPASQQHPTVTQVSNGDETRASGHCLIDILRVYYEFGPMVGGLVNLIDFVPRFYSPTPTNNHQQPSEAHDKDSQQQQQQVPKEAATESLTRLVRRSLAWFEAERKRILDKTATSKSGGADDDRAAVNLKVCNLQVHHKTLLKHQLLNVNPSNVIDSLQTRAMLHEPVRLRAPITCQLCQISTNSSLDQQDWCSHLVEQTQIYQLKFVRLAYVVPVYNKYAKSIYPIRSLRVNLPASSSATSSSSSSSLTAAAANQSTGANNSRQQIDFSSSSSSCASSSSSSPAPSQTSKPNDDDDDDDDDLEEKSASSCEETEKDNENIVKELLNSEQKEECMKQAALAIVSGTNERHQRDEEAHQLSATDSALNDSPIGQLTYRLFAPCQLVKSSSCFSINPVNSSSPLSRRGSLDLNGSGLSSEGAHPSTASLLAASVGHSQTNLVEPSQTSASLSPFFPNLQNTSDFFAAATSPLTDGSLFGGGGGASSSSRNHLSVSQQADSGSHTNSKYFASNEFELVDAIKRRMEVYVTTNSMKVIAGETLVINLSDSLSCLSTAIEQTLIRSPSVRSRPSTWVCVYVLYAAVDEPHLPSQMLQAQQKGRLELINEERDEDQQQHQQPVEPYFGDDFECDPDARDKLEKEEKAKGEGEEEVEDEIEPVEEESQSVANIYNSAYDRTVALPTSPDNSDTTNRPMEPVEVLGSQVADYLWLDETDLSEMQQQRHYELFQHLDSRRRAGKKRRSSKKSSSKTRKTQQLHNHDSQCSLI